MPWTAEQFKSRHNKGLSPKQAARGAAAANAVLKKSGDEGKSIRIGNAVARRLRKGNG